MEYSVVSVLCILGAVCGWWMWCVCVGCGMENVGATVRRCFKVFKVILCL